MTRVVRGRAAPWIGSVVLHVAFIALLAAAAIRWRSDPRPEQLAIEGSVVRYEDLPSSVRSGKPLREPTPRPSEPVPPPAAKPQPQPQPAPEPEAVPDTRRQEEAAQKLEQQRRAAEQKQAAEQSVQAERVKAAAAEAERKRAETEAAEARKRVEAKQQQEAIAAKQKQAEQAKAASEAKLRSEREAELKRALASEEEGEAVARSGVVDEYRSLLIQTIERNWIKPPSARAGLQCTLYVTQATGGTVIDVKIGECNGDQAVRESVANAVYRSSPLPAPRDPRAFERRLVMVFKPTE